MPRRSLFMLLGAISLGLLAVVVMRFYLSATTAAPVQTAAPRGPSSVVVAAEAFKPNSKLASANFRVETWPAERIPAGSYATLASVPRDRTVIAAVKAGEALLASQLSPPEVRINIATRIAIGMRAATLRVTDVTGAGGFVMPGERVDVILTRHPTNNEPAFADLLAADVRVIAINQDADEAKIKPEVVQSVTIEVTPFQAQKLALAAIVGTLSLTLRNPHGEPQQVVPTATMANLRDGPPAQLMSVARIVPRARRTSRGRDRGASAAVGATIEVVRGTDTARYRVASNE